MHEHAQRQAASPRDWRRGLYAITPEEADDNRLLERVHAILPFAAMLQHRDKQSDAATRLSRATALQQACTQAGVALIVNDDARLAHAVGAAGVHLGEEDGAIADARVLLGSEAIIGASCYGRIELAEAAKRAGADYVAFGAFFHSRSKPEREPAPHALFAQARSLGLPVVAIGGITPDNVHKAIDAGADLAAVIGGVFDAPDPAAAARAIAAAFD